MVGEVRGEMKKPMFTEKTSERFGSDENDGISHLVDPALLSSSVTLVFHSEIKK